jgi:hypothetical protein
MSRAYSTCANVKVRWNQPVWPRRWCELFDDRSRCIRVCSDENGYSMVTYAQMVLQVERFETEWIDASEIGCEARTLVPRILRNACTLSCVELRMQPVLFVEAKPSGLFNILLVLTLSFFLPTINTLTSAPQDATSTN